MRGLRLVLAVTGTALLVVVALGILSRSNLFHVRRIQVSGASHLSRADVVHLSGLSVRTNVLWADTAAAARRLEDEPWVAQASVTRDLPFTIRIQITERTPVAVVQDRNRPLLIAGDGITLGVAPARTGLPMIEVPPRPALSGPAPGLSGPAKVLGALAPGIRAQVRRVVLGIDGTVRLALAGGVSVDYGWPEQLVEKARTLAAVMSWARGQAATLRAVSLVAPHAPAASFAG
ncbi:MAG TPA: FtsQ-type POTRA domain-containing protein [Actinomycetota bacterium]